MTDRQKIECIDLMLKEMDMIHDNLLTHKIESGRRLATTLLNLTATVERLRKMKQDLLEKEDDLSNKLRVDYEHSEVV